MWNDGTRSSIQISQSTVSRIFTAWITFYNYHKLKQIPIWPSQHQIDSLISPTIQAAVSKH